MAQMIRKQIYIYKRQQAQLKRISAARGVSEAEIIRNALDREVNSQIAPYHYDPDAWERLMEFIGKRIASGQAGEPYKWRREDAYEERENHYFNNQD